MGATTPCGLFQESQKTLPMAPGLPRHFADCTKVARTPSGLYQRERKHSKCYNESNDTLHIVKGNLLIELENEEISRSGGRLVYVISTMDGMGG